MKRYVGAFVQVYVSGVHTQGRVVCVCVVCVVCVRVCLYEHVWSHRLKRLVVGVNMCMYILPLACPAVQYKTEADKKGYCFICHIAAYEFERRADVSS